MFNSLKFGLIGAGAHGRNAVIPAFGNSKKCTLVAVADVCRENLQMIDQPHLPHYDSLEEMLTNEKLDAVYIATLANTHCEIALAALDAGLHVVCEKPMAANRLEAQKMLDSAQHANRELIVMFESRFHQYNQKIKEWIAGGYLGQVQAIHLQHFGKHPLAQPRRKRLLDEAGCLDCGIHTLDLARFWTGGSDWEIIHALGTWYDEEVKNPPHVGILGRLANGVMVTFENSFSYGYRVDSEPDGFRKNTLAIVGTKGVIIDSHNPEYGFSLITDEHREWVRHQDYCHYDEIPKVLDCFAKSLAGEAEEYPLLPRAVDGIAAQYIVDEVNLQSVKQRPKFPSEPERSSFSFDLDGHRAIAAVSTL